MIAFKIFDVRCRLSFPAVMLFTLSVIISPKGSMISLCIFSTIFHELGHLLMIYRISGKPKSISVNLSDIAIQSNTSRINKNQELLIDIAGPAVNFALSSVSIILYVLLDFFFLKDFCLCSLFLGMFNMVPLKSLDGGNIFHNLLTRRYSLKAADRILNIISIILIIPFFTVGFSVLFFSKYNYSLLLIAIYLILLLINKEMR